MKTPINWATDPKSWLSHTLYMVAVYIVLGFLFTPAAGAAIASTVIYIREVLEYKHFEFWNWSKWDSILDFVIPIVVLSLLFNFVPQPDILWSLLS